MFAVELAAVVVADPVVVAGEVPEPRVSTIVTGFMGDAAAAVDM